MTKKRYAVLFISFCILAFFFFQKEERVNTFPVIVKKEKFEIKGKKVIGLAPGKEKEEIKKIHVVNTVSETWKENLEQAIIRQGGNSVKDVTINKVDSFIWSHDGIALHVESVIVKLKGDDNSQTSFRVLVDAQNGKILRNWDQPIFDPANPREGFRIEAYPASEVN